MILVAVSPEQTLPKGFSGESVEFAIIAIPDGFYQAEVLELPRLEGADIEELGIRSELDTSKTLKAVDRVREYSSRLGEDEMHLSFVRTTVGELGRYVVGVGDVVIYLKDGIQPLPKNEGPEKHILG